MKTNDPQLRPASVSADLDRDPRPRAWVLVLSLAMVGFVGLVTWDLCRMRPLVMPVQEQELRYAPVCDNPAIQPFYGLRAT